MLILLTLTFISFIFIHSIYFDYSNCSRYDVVNCIHLANFLLLIIKIKRKIILYSYQDGILIFNGEMHVLFILKKLMGKCLKANNMIIVGAL